MSKNTKQQLLIDRKMMRNSLRLAKKGYGFVAPNPLVGATIVKDNRIIGEGWHQKFGEEHAEINAIKQATESVQNSTIYISLEPCSHQGKTGACSLELIKSGFKRVVIACLDPNPLVAGNGVKMLQDAGIEVEVGILKDEASLLNERFFKFIKNKHPFIALKMASSLDGKICTFTGESQWITNEKSRKHVHLLRSKYSAILVGINTVLMDNPSLNVRLKGKQTKNPLRIVLDSSLQIPLDSKILDINIAPTCIATSSKADLIKIKQLESKGVRILKCPLKNGHIDLQFLITKLGELDLDSLLVEGGGTVNFSFSEEKLIDKVYAFIAPTIIGGKEAKTGIEGQGFATLKETLELTKLKYTQLDNDLLIEGYTLCSQD